ncbi:MAG TPA: pyrroloquinoline quinone-dependent dehydrogenase [Acidobacteriaceae bacterium]|nr:pyrroloquinoline quinone-dependent dehydrogenase [Acidobacteriaceae bacterium]
MRFSKLVAALLLVLPTLQSQLPAQGWPTYGGDSGGTRYSTSAQITRENLSHLHPAWTFHTHALDQHRSGFNDASFEATPILSGNTLYFTSPFDVVFAIDARTGQQRWAYDPHLKEVILGDILTSRGVALWTSTEGSSPYSCEQRIFLGTIDGRLMALDAATGKPCSDFGDAGEVDLTRGVAPQAVYRVTSPPAVIGNTVVVGSMIGDDQFVDSGSGIVRAFDTRTGKQLWTWDPIPWARAQAIPTGAANTWSTISADPALNLIYLPTSSAAPDYYGGMRPGDNRDADSIVALNASTGKKVWAFQAVHHDLWDYDIPAQPLLFTFRGSTPAVAITTKMGLVFVLDRRTGHPLYPLEEVPVPQTDVRGEQTSATQPFQPLAALSSFNLAERDPAQTWQRSSSNKQFCQAQMAGLRYEGIYTPPSTRGSILFPGNLGGVNWGSAALDPSTGILYANTNRVAFKVRLISRYGPEGVIRILRGAFFDWANWGIAAGIVLASGLIFAALRRRTLIPSPFILALTAGLMLVIIPISRHTDPPQLTHFGYDIGEQRKAPYLVERSILVDHDGNPCVPPPWGAISAINLNTGTKLWQSPLGSKIPGQHTGALNFGGPIVTASGIVFTAAAEDPYLRAFDAASGAELWRAQLPVPAQSTPMTYTLDGRQYIVIAAGGHADHPDNRGDSLIAFALDR